MAVGEALAYAVLARSAATMTQAEGGHWFSKSVVAAIRTLAGQPVGPVLLLVLACGLALLRGLLPVQHPGTRQEVVRLGKLVDLVGQDTEPDLGAALAAAGLADARARRDGAPAPW